MDAKLSRAANESAKAEGADFDPGDLPGGGGPSRGFGGRLATVMQIALVIIGLFYVAGVHELAGMPIHPQQYYGLFWALVIGSVFLTKPIREGRDQDHVPWYDWILTVLGMATGIYVMVDYDTLVLTQALIGPETWIPGLVLVAVLIEATRRGAPTTLLILLLVFLVYSYVAEFMPGVLYGNAVSLERMANYLYLDQSGLLGLPIAVVSTLLLAFLLLGNILFLTGGSKFYTDLSMAAFGRYRGGPAKISVMASSLFGTISGAAVSNVITTGVVTIPMMKKYGFRPTVAGGVESVASTGGQIMPPVMGAVAFLMAEYLDTSYASIVISALVPAALYYLMVFIQVDLEAAAHGIKGLPKADLPRVRTTLKEGWIFAAPLIILVVMLFSLGWSAEKSGLIAAALTLVLAATRKASRPDLKMFLAIAKATGRGMTEIGLLGGIAAVIIGCLNLSGLAFNFATLLTEIAGGSSFLLLLLAGALCIVMGMGLPTVTVYLLLAVLIAPALISTGLNPMSVHMFLLYLGMMSMLSPPVALAAYVAASIAKADPIATAWQSMRLGAVAFIVPFIFVYSPELLLFGEPLHIVISIASTTFGVILLGIGFAGFLKRPIDPVMRVMFVLSAAGLFVPHYMFDGMAYALNGAGAVLGAILLAREWSVPLVDMAHKRQPARG